jgi:transposase
MNYTQNNKISQINERTLIVGIDIAKHAHVARAQDFRGLEYSKALTFTNSHRGFVELLDWIQRVCIDYDKTSIIAGMEPTGHYWFALAQFLRQQGIKVVIVNPMHVKKSKELDDNSPTKNDIKDARVIAQLVKDGRYAEPNIPQGVYADLRIAMDIRDQINKELNTVKVRVQRWLDRFFPEFLQVFSNWDGKAALMTLKFFPIPSQIVQLGPENILKAWKSEVKRAVGIKRATELFEAAKLSIGVKEGLEMAEYELQYLMDSYEVLVNRLEQLMIKIEFILDKIPGAKEMLDIQGLGLVTVAGFLSEVCDLSKYSHPRQIQKLAGLNLKENSSGKHKGQTMITKRGRRKLRSILFKAIMPMVAKNYEFRTLHEYYTTRSVNPLKKKQSLIALSCKLIRVLYAIVIKGIKYNPKKLLDDIKHPEIQAKAA